MLLGGKMTHNEIMQRIGKSALKRGITYEQMAKDSGITIARLYMILSGTGTRLYTLLDMIDSAALEITLDDKPCETHQDVLIHLEERLYKSEMTPYKLAKKMKINSDTTNNFFDGGNCTAKTFYMICTAMGVEVRVI